MIRYISHQDIDKNLWDEAIRSSPAGNIYGYSWYLDIICAGWDALVQDEYSAVMPLTKRRKYFINYIFPPFFAQQLGIYSKIPLTESVQNEFLSSIPQSFQFIEMNLNASNSWTPDNFIVKQNNNYVLTLGRHYSEITGGYSENHIRNIKKASKQQMSFFKSANVKDVINMFRTNRGMQVENLKNEHYVIFEKLQEAAAKKNQSQVWIVNNQYGLPVAGAVFFYSHNGAIFIFSGATQEGKSLSAMHYLIDEFVKEHALTLNQLDFEGSNDPDLARFYKGFGSTEFVYLQIKKNLLPAPWKWFKH